MKTLLTTLNSKYIHSNLAIRSIKAYCQEDFSDIELSEFSINDKYERIIGKIISRRPDLLGFSCYIWNIKATLDIAGSIKKIMPETQIILGGPEVSYDSIDILKSNPYIDFIAAGEGEKTFHELLSTLNGSGDMSKIKGLTWRRENNVYFNGTPDLLSLDSIPFVYRGGLEDLANKIIYYETSRGCPYKCQYCLSSNTDGVRLLSMNRVNEELAYFVRSGVRQIKLVDRTFNCNPARAREIFKFLIELGGSTNFHFEMAGDIIDNETLSILEKAPTGLFQFEIGVQSVNRNTLRSVQRHANLKKIEETVTDIIENDNIHLHLDLIAGLPEEDIGSMGNSINAVIKLKPHRLQLGFLKLLKGSGLRENSNLYEYKFTDYPPYEVLSNRYISYGDLKLLKQIEILVENYYNTHRFDKTISRLISLYGGNAFELFRDMSIFWEENGFFSLSHSNDELYTILMGFIKSAKARNVEISCESELLSELLLFDYCRHIKPIRYPDGLKPYLKETTREKVKEFFRNDANIKEYLPGYNGHNVKQLMRKIHVEAFQYPVDRETLSANDKDPSVILFDYECSAGVLRKAAIRRLDIV